MGFAFFYEPFFSARISSRSMPIANTAESRLPQRIFAVFMVRRPSNRMLPRPPALMDAAIVAIPTVETSAIRSPAISAFFASGT